MAFYAVGVAAVSVVGSLLSSNAQAKARDRRIRAQREAAKYEYKSTEAALNMMKANKREATVNSIGEILRAGAANNRTMELQSKQAISKVVASNEGLTTGKSKGRQLISMQMEVNNIKASERNKYTSAISQALEQKDMFQNEANNKMIEAHNKMAAVLSSRGEQVDFGTNALVAGLGGAVQGYSMGASASTGADSIAQLGTSTATSSNTSLSDSYFKSTLNF